MFKGGCGMHTNETIFTPLFRYMIWCIEKDNSEDLSEAYSEIRNYPNDNTVDYSAACIERTLNLLQLKSEQEDKMYSYWKNELLLIEKEKCSNCVFCKNCRKYFWLEIGEILFQETNVLKQDGKYLPIRRIPAKIEQHLTSSKKTTDLYFYSSKRKKNKIDDGCIVLKGMSSSTPSLLNGIYDTNEYSGGGFYVRHNGIGIAIDPGYHFLDNLHHYGLSVLDINVVIVTHEHIDHNNDMRLLDDLHYAVYKYEENTVKLKWFLDKVSYDVACIYQKNGTGFDEKANELICVDLQDDRENKILLKEEPEFYVKFFSTKHIQDKRRNFKFHTFGCQFSFKEKNKMRSLVYTSDTRYFPELVDQIEFPDILIANISGVYEDDFMLVKEKERHLGYYGCYHLLDDIKKKYKKFPELVILSEFWNGESDIRFDVSSFLDEQIIDENGDTDLRIVPGEVGMTFHLTDGAVRCSQCGKFSKKFLVRKPNNYKDKIRIICTSCVY